MLVSAGPKRSECGRAESIRNAKVELFYVHNWNRKPTWAIPTFTSIWIVNFWHCSMNNEVEMISYSIVWGKGKKANENVEKRSGSSSNNKPWNRFTGITLLFYSQWCSIQCQLYALHSFLLSCRCVVAVFATMLQSNCQLTIKSLIVVIQ